MQALLELGMARCEFVCAQFWSGHSLVNCVDFSGASEGKPANNFVPWILRYSLSY